MPQIVYVGDGIVAGVNSDPQAFAARVRQLAASAAEGGRRQGAADADDPLGLGRQHV